MPRPYSRFGLSTASTRSRAQPDIAGGRHRTGLKRALRRGRCGVRHLAQLLADLRGPQSKPTLHYPECGRWRPLSPGPWRFQPWPAGRTGALPAPRTVRRCISAYKLDLTLLETWRGAIPTGRLWLNRSGGRRGSLHGCGGTGGPGQRATCGHQAVQRLARLLKGLDLGLLPLRLTPYTQAMFPMKFFEYLAAGLPVVATPSTPCKAFARPGPAAPTHAEAFATAIAAALRGEGPAPSRAVADRGPHLPGPPPKRCCSDLMPTEVGSRGPCRVDQHR